LFLTPSLACGGSEKYISLLCNNIDTGKFDVTLAVLDNSNPFYTITNDRITVIDLHTPRVRNAIFKIRRLVKQLQPDIVFSISNHLNVLLGMSRWLFPRHIKMVARESSLVSSNIQHAKYPVVYRRLVKRFYKNFDRIVCQSAAMQQDLVDNFNIPENKTVVIHNPVALLPQEIQPVLPVPPYKFITVARLSKEKGIDRLIQSVAALKAPFQYYIIGDGEERAALEMKVQQLGLGDSIFFAGKKEQPYAGMEDAALFLMGSHYEGFPNVLLEAGTLGLPVIAFDAPGGINEIIEPGVNGLLVPNNDIAAFTVAIEKALELHFDRAIIKANTAARFSVEKAITTLEVLFKAL